ncbi:MAG: hypothetical protein NZM25_03165 [Leptospiraceae bacterium]|nr:hypothetical protein [Leptospiraceae bacterium]MDW8305986.1 hypothetical protein [Leptospiraceae bacterium]
MAYKELVYYVPDMSCCHCENALIGALGIKGVKAMAELATPKLYVDYDEDKRKKCNVKVAIEQVG